MKSLPIKIFVSITFSFPLFTFSQVDDSNIRLYVLRKNTIGKEYIFGRWNAKGGTETHLKYLGSAHSKHHKTYKIINSSWIWGLSRRATNRILVFNEKNQYLGNYPVTMIVDLPTEMKNGILIFKNKDISCDLKISSAISLRKGLPKEFFRKCKAHSGSFYGFDGIN